MIVRARLKARNETETAIGWQVERFAREGKNMKPLDDYLKTPATPEQSAADLRGMISRMMERQEARDGNR